MNRFPSRATTPAPTIFGCTLTTEGGPISASTAQSTHRAICGVMSWWQTSVWLPAVTTPLRLWDLKIAATVSFQWKNPDFLLKNPDFLLKNDGFRII